MQDTQTIGVQLKKNLGFLTGLTVTITLVTLLTSLLMPELYSADTRLLAANSRFSDKSRLVGEEISELYSAFGSYDDLDRLFATAKSSRLMYRLVDSFGLVGYYKLRTRGPKARFAALRKLQSRVEIVKTEYGELHLKVWDRHPDTALAICEAMIRGIQVIQQDMHTAFYASSLRQLEQSFQAQSKIHQADTAKGSTPNMGLTPMEAGQYLRSIAETRMAMHTAPAVLLVLDPPVAAVKPGKPRLWLNLGTAFLLSLLSGMVYVLLVRGRNLMQDA